MSSSIRRASDRAHGARPLLGVLVGLLLVAVEPLPAQSPPLPTALQAELITKILTFDRALARHGSTVRVGVLYQSGSRSSVAAMRDLTHAFNETGAQLPDGVRLHVVGIAIEDELPSNLRSRVDILFVTPLRAVDVGRIVRIAGNAGVLTITASPEYERAGAAIALVPREDRPHIVLNLAMTRQSGADFGSRLLRLVEVVE